MTPGEAVGELSSQIVTVVSCDTRHGNFHSKDLFALVTALRPFVQMVCVLSSSSMFSFADGLE